MSKTNVINTSGTRKRSVARANLKKGTGKVRFNYQLIDVVEPELAKLKLKEPLILVEDLAKTIDIDVKVSGGGFMSQIDAARVAICRGLVELGGEEVKQTLLAYDRNLLVPDTRRKEVCKPNDSKARAKRQKSYR